MTKLDIGGATNPYQGFTPWDISAGQDACDLSTFADGTVDEIRASHVLEHLSFSDAHKAVKEWARALRTGGRLRVAVPDMAWIRAHWDDPMSQFYLMGGQTDAHDFHKSVWDEPRLRALLGKYGFEVAEARWVSDGDDCARKPVSLNLEGSRVERQVESGPLTPLAADAVFPALNVRVICTGPRLGFMDHWACVLNTIHSMGLPYKFATGAFWHQGIDRLLTECMDEGVDIAVTLDYDTIWLPQQLDYLLHQLMLYPQLDAIAAVQPKRETGEILLNWKDGKNPGEVDPAKPLLAATAHFGLTAFRVSSLKRLPRPWLTDIPAPNGGFGDGRIDPDMAFWKRFQAAGLNLAVSPAVRVGHLEKRAACYDDDMKLGYPSVSQWQERTAASEPWKSYKMASQAVDA